VLARVEGVKESAARSDMCEPVPLPRLRSVARHLLAALLLCALGGAPVLLPRPLQASDLQAELQRRWEGAWVVLAVPSASNCDTLHTNNEVVRSAGGVELVSRGAYAFEAGELARVSKIDLKRRRLDLLVELWEPLLIGYRDGPFELARRSTCKVELLFPLEREAVKSQRIEAIEAVIEDVAERYVDEGSARASEAWNGRQVEPLPEGYEQTWIDYQVWKYATAIEETGEEIERLSHRGRYRDDAEYALGYAAGLEHHHSLPDDCIALAEASAPYNGGSPPRHYDKDQKDDWRSGYNDGSQVAFRTKAITGLSSCLANVR
jgi:hypothetical protein